LSPTAFEFAREWKPAQAVIDLETGGPKKVVTKPVRGDFLSRDLQFLPVDLSW
jgi:hypothetical protein